MRALDGIIALWNANAKNEGGISVGVHYLTPRINWLFWFGWIYPLYAPITAGSHFPIKSIGWEGVESLPG